MKKTHRIKILLFISTLTTFLYAQNQPTKNTDQRGLLPELHTSNSNESENDEKNIKSEVLISRAENKAISALESIIIKKKKAAHKRLT